jgi:IS30 family transposase
LALTRKKRGCQLDSDQSLKDFVITKLCCHYWSPEAIAGWLKHRQKEIQSISHESIYAWIYRQSQKKDKLWKFLARNKAKRGLRKFLGFPIVFPFMNAQRLLIIKGSLVIGKAI